MKGKITVGEDSRTLYAYISRASANARFLCSNIPGHNHLDHFERLQALRPKVKKPNLHLILRLAPEDRTLSDNEWKQMVRQTLNGMEMDPLQHSYVAFMHSIQGHGPQLLGNSMHCFLHS